MEFDKEYIGKLGMTYTQAYLKDHEVLSNFEGELEKYWGRKWKANTTVGRLRMCLLHRPGKEFSSVGKPTPWPPHDSSLAAWRMPEKPNIGAMIEHHENLVKAYKDEGVEVVIRKPDPNDPPYQVKSIYCDDVCHPAVYGQVILRMYDHIRRGEEVPTYQTLAEIGCPVVGMIIGTGMAEGGTIGWLDEKHLVIAVHYARGNTRQPEIMRANEFGHMQFANIVKLQDPEVDVRLCPGYGGHIAPLGITYTMIDRHTSVLDPKQMDPYLVDWMKAEMDWEFIVPPDELCRSSTYMGFTNVPPETGVVLRPRKILVPCGQPKATKWLESIGVEVVEVEVSNLVWPKGGGGTIHCLTGSLIRDPEPKGY